MEIVLGYIRIGTNFVMVVAVIVSSKLSSQRFQIVLSFVIVKNSFHIKNCI